MQTIHLEIGADDLQRMQGALPRRISVSGTFRWNDEPAVRVEIRFKGNSSSPPDWPYKRSFLISFGEFDQGRRFHGLRHVALDNGIQFGGLFSERLVTDILRGVGVKAARCNYARVSLNGKPAGVYVNVERIDRSFLARHFTSDSGQLFKVDEGGPGADFQWVGGDPAAYRKTFELHGGDEGEAYRALLDFLRAVNDPCVTTAELERQFDLEALLKTTAVLLLAGAFDQYTGWSPHNFYLYRNPEDRRWTYLPWDLDVGFADNAFGRIPVLEGWHAAWPAPVPGRPLMERMVTDPELLARYRKHAQAILEEWFRPEVLVPKLRGLHAQIRTALEDDPYPLRRATVPSDAGIEDAMASMEKFMRARYTLARAQLASPGSRPAPKALPPEPAHVGPSPGPASADAPTELRVVKVSGDRVELQWVDHAQGEVAYVVQRCAGGECADFVNAIGQAGSDLTTATDRQVQPGMTYRYRVYAVFPSPQGPRGSGVSNIVTVKIPE
ncbi:MAG: CotH kinase family protein [Verrucomicrobiales bacterium]|nr:CotH kinase family protein [Verrucomicrobiales bacterium]